MNEDKINEYKIPYNLACKYLNNILSNLNEELGYSLNHNPIHSIDYRIKSNNSIKEKLVRKGYPKSIKSLSKINDIAGVRVVCDYVNDVFYIAQLLSMHNSINIITQKNYINYPKDNGYRSLHLIVSVDIFYKSTMIKVPVEIQIRTIAMDCWASLEHEMKYKKEIKDDNIEQELLECASLMARTDAKMQKIYQQINAKWHLDSKDL
ncbi:MAG: GTP pyrophosphokinase family protein [Thomasclavelia sp.]|nr:GTP pyrophosphokinase family protein [Thomasclavelia sp.]